MFIYSYNKDETQKLKEMGLKIIFENDSFSVFQQPKKVNFDLSELQNIKISNRMMF